MDAPVPRPGDSPAKRARPMDTTDGSNGLRRIVLYSHDTLGFGHLRRNLMLAARLKAMSPAPEVLLIAGTSEASAFALPDGVDLITLPAYAKQSCGSYVPRRLSMDLAELRDIRAGIIKAAVKRIRPDLFIADNVPLGAQNELEPALRWLVRRPGTTRVLGLRDVLDDRSSVRMQWLRDRNVEAVNAFYTDVWVYGDPRVHDPVADSGLSGAIRARVAHTGYLLRPLPPVSAPISAPYILCTVGGGRDGAALLEAFVAAPLPAGLRAVVVTGSQLDEARFARIEGLAATRPDMEVRRFVPDLMPLLAGAERVVTMGGYNTVCEVLRLGKPALVVPRVLPRREQLVRAERFAALGLLDMLHPDRLTPAALGDWLATPPRAPAADRLDTGGLDRVAALAAAALGQSPGVTLAA
jgi:predicted glycosyltransferase